MIQRTSLWCSHVSLSGYIFGKGFSQRGHVACILGAPVHVELSTFFSFVVGHMSFRVDGIFYFVGRSRCSAGAAVAIRVFVMFSFVPGLRIKSLFLNPSLHQGEPAYYIRIFSAIWVRA